MNAAISSVALAIVLAGPVRAAEPAGVIAEKIAELDNDVFAVRESASAALLEIGAPAIPSLIAAVKSPSPELRARAGKLVVMIRERRLALEFEKLGRQEGDDLDVEHGMWLIATILDPDLKKESITARFDEMAVAVREAIGDGVEPAELPPARLVEVLGAVLGTKYGLQGDTVTYDHPDNSSVHRVLERKKGLPIILSEIAVAVGRRLDVPLVGLPVPGRYMMIYDGTRAPEGAARKSLVVDPFGGWVVVDPERQPFVPRLGGKANPLGGSGRETLVRMLNNMASDFFELGKIGEARAVGRCRGLLDPSVVPEK